MAKTDIVPTLNFPEIEMFSGIVEKFDSLLVYNLGFFGLVEYAVRIAFVENKTGCAVDRLRRVAKMVSDRHDAGSWENSDDRFSDVEYAAIYDCSIVHGGKWKMNH